MIVVVKATLHLVFCSPMPILLIVVTIALAIGGAMYYKSSSEVTRSDDADTVAPGGIADMLGDAEAAAEAMSDGMGGAMNELVTTEGTVPTATPGTAPTNNAPTAAASTYTDGTYTMRGAYVSPAGRETVTVSVTLANDIITDTTFTGDATNPSSVRNQERFAEGYSSFIVGKDIDSVELGVVNGSSLTGIGFNDALAQIKADARI